MAIQFDNTNTGSATLKPAASGTLVLTLPTADGTSGQALTTNGSGQLSFSTPAGGVTGFSAAESTSAPNVTQYVDSLTANAASADADVAFVAKGQGATLAQVPDNTASGGGKRGTYATDWQKVRSSSAQIASGTWATIAGGQNNTASAMNAVVGGGISNTASGAGSFIGGGESNIASLDDAVVSGGFTNTASGFWSVVSGGSFNTASGDSSFIAGGDNNTASGPASGVFGRFGTSRSLQGYQAFAAANAPIEFVSGVTQAGLMLLGRATANATPATICSSTGIASSTNQLVLPNNSAYYFKGTVIAGVTGGGDTKGWVIEGVIKRGASAASTALVGTPVVNLIAQDAGASTWAVAVDANTTTGCLRVLVTGQAATIIRWVVKLETTEMTF